ncbi:hypothetical protein LRS14_27295 [Aquincola sp. J276]|nr:hypothetical protein [Aquincola sp. J276]
MERFDRQWMDGRRWIARLPRADLCQAMHPASRAQARRPGDGPALEERARHAGHHPRPPLACAGAAPRRLRCSGSSRAGLNCRCCPDPATPARTAAARHAAR